MSSNAELDFSKLEVDSENAPVFLKPMLVLVGKNIDSALTSESELLEILLEINAHFKNYPKASTKTFFMSEFYKNFFQLGKNSNVKSSYSSVTVQTLQEAKKKLEKNAVIMSKMSEFLMVEIFLSYQDLIQSKSEVDIERLNRVNKYFGNWVGQFLKVGPKEFDKLVAQVSGSFLKSVSKNSKLISLHTREKEDFSLIFKNLELITPKTPPPEDSSEETIEAKSPIENLTIEPTSGASEQIDAVIEEVEEKNP